jgi:tRNA threonylcarbamoyladenosine biosynthesis protein TsaE
VIKIVTKSPEETQNTGKGFAGSLKPGDIIGLKGDLGSGKTQFVKGICRHFNIDEGVSSPTFIIANQYEGTEPDNDNNDKIRINHLDLYRLKKSSEIESLGMDSYFDGESITLIEWSELMEEYLGEKLITVSFEHGEDIDGNERVIILPE